VHSTQSRGCPACLLPLCFHPSFAFLFGIEGGMHVSITHTEFEFLDALVIQKPKQTDSACRRRLALFQFLHNACLPL
jgi:hypothetical protein